MAVKLHEEHYIHTKELVIISEQYQRIPADLAQLSGSSCTVTVCKTCK